MAEKVGFVGIALAAGREYGVVLPVTALVDQMFDSLMARGREAWDRSEISAGLIPSTERPHSSSSFRW
jgi:3-hydroxyisobutyrate dehydrogenase-like beta-hydroxyacid dehydrogenase